VDDLAGNAGRSGQLPTAQVVVAGSSSRIAQ
jgi:hypothetical protein